MVQQELVNRAAALIESSERLVILTGAGVSKESGVPTFRDALDGLWARYDPQELATPQAFMRNPKLVWDWYEYRRALVRNARPNPGHMALAALEDLLPQVVVITQNVDDLHQQAGSSDIIPLHGALMRSKCFDACRGEPTLIEVNTLASSSASDGPPACPYCGGWVRPDVVWYGENLPEWALMRALELSRDADVMLVVGTSGMVQPSAGLPGVARQGGAKVIEVNPNRSGITNLAELWLAGPSGEVMPRIVDAVRANQKAGSSTDES